MNNSLERQEDDYYYGSGAAYALGSVTSITGVHTGPGYVTYSTTTNTYDWHDGAVQNYTSNTSNGTTNTSIFNYVNIGGTAQLQSVDINDGQARDIIYKNDINGQVVRLDTTYSNSTTNKVGPHEVRYRFAGREMGFTGNNSTRNVDYEASIIDHQVVSQGGIFRDGQTYGATHTDFDQNYNAINGFSEGSSGTYRVQAGDTLQSIASNLWGDSSLWYKIAEVNGISGAAAINEGQTLIIPAGVLSNTHTAETFRPYDPSEAIGNTSPTAPKPGDEGGKCGVFGQIILAAVAIAIQFIPVVGQIATFIGGTVIGGAVGAVAGSTIGGIVGGLATNAVAGAIGSIASQGVGVAFNIQDKFSWKAVGTAAISSAFGGGGGKVSSVKEFVSVAAQGAASNAITQGISVAVGLQSKFSWAGVAGAGIGAGVGGYVGGKLPGAAKYNVSGELTQRASLSHSLGTSAASALANAATRSAIDGSNFGDNIVAAIPDVIGGAVRGALAPIGSKSPPGPLDFLYGFIGSTTDSVYDKVVTVGNAIGGALSSPVQSRTFSQRATPRTSVAGAVSGDIRLGEGSFFADEGILDQMLQLDVLNEELAALSFGLEQIEQRGSSIVDTRIDDSGSLMGGILLARIVGNIIGTKGLLKNFINEVTGNAERNANAQFNGVEGRLNSIDPLGSERLVNASLSAYGAIQTEFALALFDTTLIEVATGGLGHGLGATGKSGLRGLGLFKPAARTSQRSRVLTNNNLSATAIEKSNFINHINIDKAIRRSGRLEGVDLNNLDTISNFSVYELQVNNSLFKIGKANASRITQKTGLPTRVHEQIRRLELEHGIGAVKPKLINLGRTSSGHAINVETFRLRTYYNLTGTVPPGNIKSFKP